MNELQAKLARRRTLNGEGLNSASSKDESSITAASVHSGPVAAFVEPETVPKKPIKSKPATPSTSSTAELQNKLARRRNLNGETIPSPAPAQPSSPEEPPSISDAQEVVRQIPIVVSAVANESVADPEVLVTPQHDDLEEPEVVHHAESSDVTNNSHVYQNEEMLGSTSVESQGVEALIEERTTVEVLEATVEAETEAITSTHEEVAIPGEISVIVAAKDHIPETTSQSSQSTIDERDYDNNPEFTPIYPEVQIESSAQVEEVVEEEKEEEKAEELPQLPPPPIPSPPIPMLFQSVEDTMNMIDQEILQLRSSVFAPPSSSSQQEQPEFTNNQHQQPENEGNNGGIPPPIPSFLLPPLPPSIPPRTESDDRNLSFSSKSQSRNLSSLSPLTSSKSHKTIQDKENSVLSSPPKGWYPGKYLLQRINSTSNISTEDQEKQREKQRKSSQIISMNQEEAQLYYNALLTSHNESATVTTPPTPSSKSRVFASTQSNHEEKSRVMLIEENVSLREEILRLQDELDRRQAIIESYQLTHLLTRSTSGSFDHQETSPNASLKSSQKVEIFEEKSGVKSSDKSVEKRNRENNDTRRRRVGLGFYTQHNNGEDDDEDDGNLDLFGSDKAAAHNLQTRKITTTNYNFDDQPPRADFEEEAKRMTTSLEDEKALFGGVKYDPRKLNNNEQDLIRSYNYSSSRRSVHPSSSEFSTSLSTAKIGKNSTFDSALFGPETSEESSTITPPANKKQAQSVEAHMEYEAFLQRFVKAVDLQEITRKFIFSVLGPQGDTTEPPKKAKLDYVFYGTHRLDERCHQFFDDMQERFCTNKYFKDLDEEHVICARDCLEQHVMNRLGPYAFKLCETPEDDVALERRMKLLSSFLTPEMLDIKPDYFNETLLAVAATELKEINIYRTPREKANCVVKCVTIIFRSLSVARVKQEAELMQQRQDDQQTRKENGIPEDNSSDDNGSGNKRPEMTLAGADDFLPLFIWVVLQSRVPRLYSNCEYVQAYLNPARLKGQPGYCLINLHSAVSFLSYLDPTSLNVDVAYFEQKMLEAEAALGG